jgi:hypothetical protein
VIDARADDEAERVEPRVLDEQELVDREVGGEQATLILRQALAPMLGEAFAAGGVISGGRNGLLPSRVEGLAIR